MHVCKAPTWTHHACKRLAHSAQAHCFRIGSSRARPWSPNFLPCFPSSLNAQSAISSSALQDLSYTLPPSFAPQLRPPAPPPQLSPMSSLLLQIEGALADLYSPTTTSSRRQEVEAHLESFRAQTPDAWRPALEFLQLSSTPASPSLQMMYYASSVIDHFATPKIHDSLPPQTQVSER